MSIHPASPPYFEHLLAQLAAGDPRTLAAFGKHVHWGYWDDPALADGSPKDYGVAAERLCEAVLASADIQDGQRVLDVGCGFGGTLSLVDERHRGLELCGVNIDARQLERASDRLSSSERNHIRLIQADAARLPLADASFDVVLAVECVFHFDRARFFAEAHRVLAPGGALVLSDFVPDERTAGYLHAISGATSDAIRWTYGAVDFAWPISRYQKLAMDSGLALVEQRDITRQTLPTYDFLRASVSDWPSTDDVNKFLAATRLLEKASRRGWMTYQILRFEG
jgi:SAM-dependent methyltransferase